MVILECREELRDVKTEVDEETDPSSPDWKKSIASMSETSSSIIFNSFSSSCHCIVKGTANPKCFVIWDMLFQYKRDGQGGMGGPFPGARRMCNCGLIGKRASSDECCSCI